MGSPRGGAKAPFIIPPPSHFSTPGVKILYSRRLSVYARLEAWALFLYKKIERRRLKKMGAIEKRLTDEMKEEIVHRYVESRADPFAVPITQTELAKEYGVGQATISRVISDSGVVERVRRRTKASVELAQAIAEEAAAHAMRATVESAFKPREEKYEYINQGDRRDILDRAGVRAEKKEAADVNISFTNGGFDVGMPGSKGK